MKLSGISAHGKLLKTKQLNVYIVQFLNEHKIIGVLKNNWISMFPFVYRPVLVNTTTVNTVYIHRLFNMPQHRVNSHRPRHINYGQR